MLGGFLRPNRDLIGCRAPAVSPRLRSTQRIRFRNSGGFAAELKVRSMEGACCQVERCRQNLSS